MLWSLVAVITDDANTTWRKEDGLSGELEGKEVVLMAVWVEGYLLSIADSKH